MLVTKKIAANKKSLPYGFLIWKNQKYTEQKEIKGFLSIGRGETNQLVLDDDYVSRHHARIEYKEDKELFILKDMNSKNGVFLNGNRIYQAALGHNDLIKIGQQVFTFSFERYNQKWQLATQSANEKWNEQLARLPHLAQNNFPILILGSSGTGKEVLSQLIHKNSSRSENTMVSINCGALTESLVESELFGHVKGSYTGAVSDRKGAFLSAKNGTLFLDEIGELPLSLQPRLLRAIETQEIKPVGSDRVLKTDVRIVAATHQNLKEKVEKKEFREDLYYRLNVVTIQVPNLQDRMQDFENFLEVFSMEQGISFSDLAVEELQKYSWPGNIRELKNIVARAKALFGNRTVDKKMAQTLLNQEESTNSSNVDLKTSLNLKEIEKKLILNLLKKYRGHQTKVASELGMPRSTLNDRLNRYNIDARTFKNF